MKDCRKEEFLADSPVQSTAAKLRFSWGKKDPADPPAYGAFTGTTLLLVSLWLGPALFLLFGGQMDFSRVEKESLIFFLPIPVLLLYALTAWFHFYRKTAGNKKTVLFIVTFLLFSFFCLFFGGPLPGLVIPALPVILAPVILIPRVWKFALARGLCLLGGVWLAWDCIQVEAESGNRFQLQLFSGLVLLLAGYVFSGLMYARAAQVPFRQMFGRGVKILWGLLAAVYLISLGMMLVTRMRTECAVKDLEKHFANPFSAQGLKTFYTNGRKIDTAFWDKLEKTTVSVEKGWEKFESRGLISSSPEGVYPPELLKDFEALMERSDALRELEKMFDRPLPARDIDYKDSPIAGVLLPELNLMRQFCRWELWRVRFAVEKNDLPGALNALKRMKTASVYLVDKPSSLIAVLVMIACENYRMQALEVLLAGGNVPETVLREWLDELERDDRNVPQINFDALYAEAVFAHDMLSGGENSEGPETSVYWICRVFPPMGYSIFRGRLELMRQLRVRKFGAVQESSWTTRIWDAGWPLRVQHKFDQLSARYRATHALIGVELEKRKTGKYPDTLENPPADPFNGRPMRYQKGTIEVSEPVWNVNQKRFEENKVRTAEGIAVWSLGANGKDDQGLNAYGGGPKGSDDVRAKMIFGKGIR